jgi:hypothetical protein
MYRVWPLLLTRTVPTPATLLALMVTAGEEDAGDVPAGWLAPELAAVLEDADPHAAAAATAPRARLPYSSRRAGARPGRWMEIFTETPFSGSESAALLPHDYEETALPDWRSLWRRHLTQCHCRPCWRRIKATVRVGDPRRAQ